VLSYDANFTGHAQTYINYRGNPMPKSIHYYNKLADNELSKNTYGKVFVSEQLIVRFRTPLYRESELLYQLYIIFLLLFMRRMKYIKK